MNDDNGNARRRKPRVGERVRFQWGKSTVEGVIVEDRGPIGAGGRRLWRIEFQLEPTYGAVIELPEEALVVGV